MGPKGFAPGRSADGNHANPPTLSSELQSAVCILKSAVSYFVEYCRRVHHKRGGSRGLSDRWPAGDCACRTFERRQIEPDQRAPSPARGPHQRGPWQDAARQHLPGVARVVPGVLPRGSSRIRVRARRRGVGTRVPGVDACLLQRRGAGTGTQTLPPERTGGDPARGLEASRPRERPRRVAMDEIDAGTTGARGDQT